MRHRAYRSKQAGRRGGYRHVTAVTSLAPSGGTAAYRRLPPCDRGHVSVAIRRFGSVPTLGLYRLRG